MHLTMAIGERTIDSVPVEPRRCKQPGYLEAMQRCLKMKHFEVILKAEQTPEFYLEVSSSINNKSKK